MNLDCYLICKKVNTINSTDIWNSAKFGSRKLTLCCSSYRVAYQDKTESEKWVVGVEKQYNKLN